MELEEGSISVSQLSVTEESWSAVDSSNYKVSVERKNITISTNDIKTGGFCYASGKVRYRPIIASFSAKVTDSAQAVNVVSASVSYNCGKYNGTINTNNVTINKQWEIFID